MAKQNDKKQSPPRKAINKKNLKKIRGGGANPAGTTTVSDFHFVKVLDKSSPKLS